MAPRAFQRLVLVGAMGIKPERGEIADQALVSYIDYVRLGFADQARLRPTSSAPSRRPSQLEQWDLNREMTFRIAWKPYMYNADAAAPARRRRDARARRVGTRGPRRAARVRRALRQGAAAGAPRGRRGRRALRRDGAAGAPSSSGLVTAPDREGPERPRRDPMHLMYFTEQPMSAYPETGRARLRRHRADVLQQALRSRRRQPPLQRVPRALPARRGGRLRRHHAERAPQRAVLHAGQVQRVRVDPGRHHQAREDRAARQPAAARRQPGAAGRGAGDDRHDLERPARLRLRARRRPGAARHRREPGLQPRALRGGARR